MALADYKTALVTGASAGIGAATVRALAAKGIEVIAVARRADRLEALAEETGATPIALDLNDTDALYAALSSLEADILVNNAGYGMFKPLVDTTLDELKDMYQTNVFGTFLMAREAAKQFIKQGSGELINISSTSSLKGSSGRTAYGSSKFALRGMTECWRDELRRHDVRVMLVNPSEVMTDFAAKAGVERERSDKKLRPKEIADAIVGALKVDARGFIPEFSVFATNPF